MQITDRYGEIIGSSRAETVRILSGHSSFSNIQTSCQMPGCHQICFQPFKVLSISQLCKNGKYAFAVVNISQSKVHILNQHCPEIGQAGIHTPLPPSHLSAYIKLQVELEPQPERMQGYNSGRFEIKYNKTNESGSFVLKTKQNHLERECNQINSGWFDWNTITSSILFDLSVLHTSFARKLMQVKRTYDFKLILVASQISLINCIYKWRDKSSSIVRNC